MIRENPFNPWLVFFISGAIVAREREAMPVFTTTPRKLAADEERAVVL